ncbi:MAG TPA: hypothetical protein VMB79_10435 [Jatrophihabitans sp.]|nr:hypothetical protein [Jatrophihabitans sp.]
MAIYPRALALGLATGGRSTLGLAALALTSADTGSWLTGRWTARASALALTAELAADKLQAAPSRLEPAGLVPRLAAGAAAGAILARRTGEPAPAVAVAGLLGLAGAAAGSVVGARWRGLVAGRQLLGRLPADLPAALVEDGACLAAAGYATA